MGDYIIWIKNKIYLVHIIEIEIKKTMIQNIIVFDNID